MFYACVATFFCLLIGISGLILAFFDLKKYNFGLYLALLSVVGTTVSIAFWIVNPSACANPRWVQYLLHRPVIWSINNPSIGAHVHVLSYAIWSHRKTVVEAKNVEEIWLFSAKCTWSQRYGYKLDPLREIIRVHITQRWRQYYDDEESGQLRLQLRVSPRRSRSMPCPVEKGEPR